MFVTRRLIQAKKFNKDAKREMELSEHRQNKVGKVQLVA